MEGCCLRASHSLSEPERIGRTERRRKRILFRCTVHSFCHHWWKESKFTDVPLSLFYYWFNLFFQLRCYYYLFFNIRTVVVEKKHYWKLARADIGFLWRQQKEEGEEGRKVQEGRRERIKVRKFFSSQGQSDDETSIKDCNSFLLFLRKRHVEVSPNKKNFSLRIGGGWVKEA